MNKSLILGVTRGLSFERLRPWIASAGEVTFADTHLICLDSKPDHRLMNACKRSLVTFVHVPEDVGLIHHHRYLRAWSWLKPFTSSQYKRVLWTDTADVVFQRRDLNWMDEVLSQHRICVGSEGVSFNQEPWNHDNLRRTFPQALHYLENQEILCSGVIGGYIDDMIRLLYDIYHYSCHVTGHEIVDQSALNAMMINPSFSRTVNVLNSSQSHMVHCAVSGPTEFFKGWGFDKAYRYGLPVMRADGLVTNSSDVPYAILHQYNRIPDWKAKVEARYAEYFV